MGGDEKINPWINSGRHLLNGDLHSLSSVKDMTRLKCDELIKKRRRGIR